MMTTRRMEWFVGALASCCIIFAMSPALLAADINWNGTAGETNDWHTGGNWVGSSVPGVGDNVDIKNGGWAEISTGDPTVLTVDLGENSNDGSLLNNNHALEITAGNLSIGSIGAMSTYEQTGSSASLNLSLAGADLNIADASTAREGTFILRGGTVTVPDQLNCSEWGTGYYYQYGGTNTVGGSIYIPNHSGATGTLVMIGGKLDMTTADKDLFIGYGNNTGVFILSNGVVNVADKLYCGSGGNSVGNYIQYGGTNTISDRIILESNSNGVSSVTVDGGRLDIGSFFEISGEDGVEGRFIMSNGTVNVTEWMIIGRAAGETGHYYQYGGACTLGADHHVSLGYTDGSTGRLTVVGGSLITTASGRIDCPSSANSSGFVEVLGDDATIDINDLRCSSGAGGSASIKFVLQGELGGVSPIACRHGADLNAVNVSLSWDVSDDFSGAAGTTYDLITADTSTIDTNGVVFTNLSEADFTLALVNSDKTLQLTLNGNYPVRGTVILIN